MEPEQWVADLAAALGVDAPDDDEVADLLDAAGTAAHTAQRWVAPVSTWLVARAGLSPADGRAAIERLAAAQGTDEVADVATPDGDGGG